MKIYIAGSSAEMVRAAAWHAKARADGFNVVSTWVEVIAKEGGVGNPRDASNKQRLEWTLTDLAQVADADVLWFLVPLKGAETRGAWGELCFAHAKDLAIICSGDTKQSIFCAVGSEFETDQAAYDALGRVTLEPNE